MSVNLHTLVDLDPLNPTVRHILEKALSDKRRFLEVYLDESDTLVYRQHKVAEDISRLRLEIADLMEVLKDIPLDG